MIEFHDMIEFYDFLAGPAALAAIVFCIVGLALRISYLLGSSRGREKVLNNPAELKSARGPIFHWLIPMVGESLRTQPVFTIVRFAFHLCLFAVPIFLLAHNLLLQEFLGTSLFPFPETVSDSLTILFIIASLFLLLRRIINPEVRICSGVGDYLALIMTMLPFITGFLAHRQVGDYSLMLVLHVLSADILLVLVPFSKLGHAVLFFFSPSFSGFKAGEKRGPGTV